MLLQSHSPLGHPENSQKTGPGRSCVLPKNARKKFQNPVDSVLLFLVLRASC